MEEQQLQEIKKEFTEEVKAELKALAENISEDAVESLFKIIQLWIANSENKFDDMLIPYLGEVKSFVLQHVEKISDNV